MVVTFFCISFVGANLGRLFIVTDYAGLLPDIAISYKLFEYPGSLYLFFVKMIIFSIAIFSVFVSIRYGTMWVAWVFCLIAVLFNPWVHQDLDGDKFIWMIIKNGLPLWLGVAAFLMYPKENNIEKFFNKNALFLPTMFTVALLWYHLSRYWRADAWYNYVSSYSLHLIVKDVVFSTVIYGMIVSLLFGPSWFVLPYFLIFVCYNPLSQHSISYKEELLVSSWLCLSCFFIKSNIEIAKNRWSNAFGWLFEERTRVLIFFDRTQTQYRRH